MDRKASAIHTIGVLTSGGDAPGMNAAIRGVVRAASYYGLQVYGIRRGYHGLWRGDFIELNSRSVSEILQHGGTFLMTARSKTFATIEGVRQGVAMARVFKLDAVVVIGGDGTLRGARDLAEQGLPVIGIPGTIDNDIGCSEYTIGYDTALNTAMEAVDKLRDTASSHERCSVIEVMGRHAGYIALNVGIAVGAEVILVPEIQRDIESYVVSQVLEGRNRGKKHYIVIVAEGTGDAIEIAKRIEAKTGLEARATILGHLQRGGSPTERDRLTASVMGVKAVQCLREGRVNRVMAVRQNIVTDLDLHEALTMEKTITAEEFAIAEILAT